MDIEISEVLRRVSLVSLKRNEKKRLSTKEPPPKDDFHMVYILFLLLGIVNILPLSFFATAYNYWMYKFRDISSEDVDLNNKTTLQRYFSPGSMISQSMLTVICMLLSASLAHTMKMELRIISSLSVVTSLFISFTVMIGVNTDTWQTGFFILTLAGLGAICGSLTLLQVSTLNLLMKFPASYMHPFLIGQGMSGIFNACLQVIALSVGTSVKASAYIYFGIGSLLILGTLLLYILGKSLPFFKYCLENNVAEERNRMFTKAEVLDILKDIWPCIIVFLITVVQLVMTTPTNALVVSENYGNGNEWNDKFFVPTITYLFYDSCSLIGRLLAAGISIKHSNRIWWVAGAILKFGILSPLLMLCNVQPRNNLPVWFPHDWQYILLLAIYAVSNGVFLNVVFLSIPKLAVGKEESAFTVLNGSYGIISGLTSPLGLLSVKLL